MVDQAGALVATSIATGVLVVHHFIISSIEGLSKVPTGSRPPEDVIGFPSAGPQSFGGKPDAEVDPALREREQRWGRIFANETDNIPICLITAWGSYVSGGDPLAQVVLVSILAGSRLLYTVVYAWKLQPHRAILFGIGLAATVGLAINGIIGSIKALP